VVTSISSLYQLYVQLLVVCVDPEAPYSVESVSRYTVYHALLEERSRYTAEPVNVYDIEVDSDVVVVLPCVRLEVPPEPHVEVTAIQEPLQEISVSVTLTMTF